MKVQATAHLRFLRMSPQKVRLIAGLVRGLKVQDALVQLTFSTKHAARPVKKLIESAIANAEHNHDIEKETLVIETIYVNEGSTLRRWMPRAMGRATPLRKRSSHITLVLAGEVDEKKKQDKKDKIEKTKDNIKEKKEVENIKKESTPASSYATSSAKAMEVKKASDDKKATADMEEK